MGNTTSISIVAEPQESSIPFTYLAIRQCLEVILILFLSPILLPIVLLLSIIILIDSGFPILYFQERPGLQGKVFKIVKFRTMRKYNDGTDSLTVDDDPRVTKVGRFLRIHRLDEIPQFWNVLTWDMALIGPRPEPLFAAKILESKIPEWKYRYVIRPGITGWQQIHQGHVTTIEEEQQRLIYDIEYINTISFARDCVIVFKTVTTMIRGVNSR